MNAMIEVKNVNTPGRTSRVNEAKYSEMRRAMEAALPRTAPGVTQAEMVEAVTPHLSEDLFPGGKTSGWWAKTVQLDLEAKELLTRGATKPLRWHWA